MSQSSRWKSQGGMNRRPTNNIVTNNNSHSNILNARTLGTEYTTIDKVADLRDVETASIYRFDPNKINFANVISYYPFNDLSYNTPLPSETTNNDISNQSLATNLSAPKPFTLKFQDPPSISGTFHKPKVAYNDLISQNVIQLDPSSQVLATDLSFNTTNAFDASGSTISAALTMSCFVYIPDSDVSTTAGQSNQFCLFAMDDLSQNALQNFSLNGGIPDGSDNLLYLWYPNKNGKAQLLYGYKSQNAAESWSYISKESPEQIPNNKWTQVLLVLAGLSIYVIVDGTVVISSSGSEIQGASYVPDQPFNINLGPYYYDSVNTVSANLTTTNTATPFLSDCKVSNWAVGPQLATAVASPGGYGHKYSVNSKPNKEGLLYYLLSKDLISFSTPTLFRSDLNLGGNLQSYGTNNFYGQSNFYTKTYFADGIITDGSSTIVFDSDVGNANIFSQTLVTTQKNASLFITNSSETGGNDFMASMLVFNDNIDIYNNVTKGALPTYVDKLQFSISGENVSVGHGFGDSSFNVFGDSVMDGSLSLINNGVLNVTGPIEANGGINTTVINSNIINVFDKLDVSGINFTNGYIGISQDTTTGPVRIGNAAGQTGQDVNSVAIGGSAGQTTQGQSSVAIGNAAGQVTQGPFSVAMGQSAGNTGQGNSSVAIGVGAANSGQRDYSVAIGSSAGRATQGQSSVAIGNNAGQNTQGAFSVAIGPNTECQNNTSVALGSGATTRADNQIVLGTVTETVKIPGVLDVSGVVSAATSFLDTGLNLATLDWVNNHTSSGGGGWTTVSGSPSTLTSTANTKVVISGSDSGSLDVSGNLSFTSDYIGISQDTTTGPIRIGNAAGQTGQGTYSVAIGNVAGQTGQGNYSVAIGNNAGYTSQGNGTIAIGRNAGFTGQLSNGVAMGNGACEDGQGEGSVAIGQSACNAGQGSDSVAIGPNTECLHTSSVALGSGATTTANNQIVLGTVTETVKIPGHIISDLSASFLNIGPLSDNRLENNVQNNWIQSAGTISQLNMNGYMFTRAILNYNETGSDTTGLIFGIGGDTDHSDLISLVTSGQTRIYILAGGTVGINTTNPNNSYILDVNGNINVTGSITSTGSCSCSSYNTTSDLRLKENISDLDNSLEKICNIRGVSYNLKSDENKTKTSGVIAQEVIEHIPEAVNNMDSEKLSVNYNSIIAHLIESVKELKREIEELKSKN